MKQQKIKIGDKELTLQDLSTRYKLELAGGMVNADMSINTVFTAEYVLKNVVVVPQGLKLEDFNYAEISALVQHARSFLDLDTKDVVVTIVE